MPKPETTAVPKSFSGIEKPKPVSRAEKIRQNGGEPLLPPLEAGNYLLGYWRELGSTGQGGFGPVPLSYQEIAAWSAGSGIVLSPWEQRLIRRLSVAWINETAVAEKPDCSPPFGEPEMEFDRNVVAKKVGDAMKSFARAKR